MKMCWRPVHQMVVRLSLVLLFCCSALAQSDWATIRGEIVDPAGALVPGATVTLVFPDGRQLSTKSNGHGEYRFDHLLAGNYILRIEAKGFQKEEEPKLQVEAGQTLLQTSSLKIEIQQEQIAVSDEEMDAEPERNQGAIVVRGSELQALSPNPQELLLQLQAMAASDLGAPAQLFVDGFTATRLPPKSSIREIRINQNPYSAQYDTMGHGRIEIFTKPGGEKLHGNLNLLGDTSALNSQYPYVQEQPPYGAFYAEGDINGPLTKSSSYFMDGDRQDVDGQSFVHAVISPTGPAYTSTVSSPRTSTDFTPRFDFQLGKVQTISVRYTVGRQTQDNMLQSQYSLPSQAIDTRHTDQTVQLIDTQTYGAHVVNETRFQYVHTNDSSVSINGSASVLVQGAFNGGGNNLGQLHDGQNQYELQDCASVLAGNHLFRFGGRLRATREGNTSTAGFNGLFIFPSIEAYQITVLGLANGMTPAQIRAAGGGASQFSVTAGNPKIAIGVTDFGAYFEDEWKMRSNMTLTPGIRYETQTDIPDHADFAPRLSYAWSIGANKDNPPKAVLRAGVGFFYQRFTPDLILNADRQNGVSEQQYVVNNPDFYPNVPNPGSLGPATLPTIYNISPLLHAPYEIEEGVSLEKQLFKKKLSLSLEYTHVRGVDQLLTRNINAPLPGTYNPADPTSGMRPLGTLQNIYQYESEGTAKRNRLYTGVQFRTGTTVLYGQYLFGYSKANTAGPNSFPSNQYDIDQDYGRATNDFRNKGFVAGIVHLPYKFDLNPFLFLQSSVPFNITTGQDLNGDSQFNDRPAFATDLNRSSVYRTRWGNFDADPLPGQKIIPFDYGTGPSLAMLNIGLSRNFSFGPPIEDPAAVAAPPTPNGKPQHKDIARRYQTTLSLQVQNLLNHVNGGLPVGVLSSPLFGQSTSLSSTLFSPDTQANRILYLNMRLSF